MKDETKKFAVQGAFPHKGGETHLLREITRTGKALANAFSGAVGISASMFGALRVVALAHPEGVSAADIARDLGVDAAAITRRLKELEKDGIIKRAPHERDGRKSVVKLTEKGRRLAAKIHERIHLLEDSLNERLNAKDVERTVKTLIEIQKFVGEMKPRY